MGLGAVPCFNIRVCAGKTRNRKTDDDSAGGRRCCIYFSNYITQRRLFLFCLLFFELVPSFLSLSRRSYRDAVFIVPVCARWWTFLIPFIIQHVRNTAETIYERRKNRITANNCKGFILAVSSQLSGLCTQEFHNAAQSASERPVAFSIAEAKSAAETIAGVAHEEIYLSLGYLSSKRKKRKTHKAAAAYTHTRCAAARAAKPFSLYCVSRINK